MSDWQAGDLQVDGLRLHYTRTGGDKPPFVMVHGFSDDGLCWTPFAELFADDYDVIMPDARGHGFSEAPERGYTPKEQANDLIGIIKALGLHKPLILGHSMGAVTALALAAIKPDLPGAILLEDPPAWWYAKGIPLPTNQQQLDKMRQSFAERKNESREELIADQHNATPIWSDAELGPWADSKLRLNPNIVELFATSTPTSMDWEAVLEHVTCPALLITADPERGAIVTTEGAEALKKIIPQLQVANIPNAGHSIHREQLDTYLTAVKAFLASL
jgi:N-formylmaleamate deformylase